MNKVLVTGGAGFIGSAVVRYIIKNTSDAVVNLDSLTYAGNLESLEGVSDNPRYSFEQVDIRDVKNLERVFSEHKPTAVMHLAAESHVDRSIEGPSVFIETNLLGTYQLLEAARSYWAQLEANEKNAFRFLHVSTDEVFGSLGEQAYFTETTPYQPNSPYSASKAGSNHLVRAWYHTYEFPVLTTNCSNNYGPNQFPEKLIPLVILNALEGKPLPIYGNGDNVRDWLYVDDHVEAMLKVLECGDPGQTYNIGGDNEKANIEVVETVCKILDELVTESAHRPHNQLIKFVEDRLGHDKRYAIDANKIKTELGWTPKHTFGTGMQKTVQWYLSNMSWCQRVQYGSYKRERLGLVESN